MVGINTFFVYFFKPKKVKFLLIGLMFWAVLAVTKYFLIQRLLELSIKALVKKFMLEEWDISCRVLMVDKTIIYKDIGIQF